MCHAARHVTSCGCYCNVQADDVTSAGNRQTSVLEPTYDLSEKRFQCQNANKLLIEHVAGIWFMCHWWGSSGRVNAYARACACVCVHLWAQCRLLCSSMRQNARNRELNHSDCLTDEPRQHESHAYGEQRVYTDKSPGYLYVPCVRFYILYSQLK